MRRRMLKSKIHRAVVTDANLHYVRGSGDLCLNGAAARLVQPGDKVIVISYADYDDAEMQGYEPRIVHVDTDNREIDAVTAELLAAESSRPAPRRYVEVPAT